MNSPKEPEPGPRRRALQPGLGQKAGRILRITSRAGEGYVRGVEVEGFIGG
jgi:hypothetical protein